MPQNTVRDAHEEKKTSSKKSERVAFWIEEIQEARKREKDFRKDAREVVAIYDAEKEDQNPYNILASNTSTLISAVFSDLPKPVVVRRFRKKDQLGKIASDAISNYLTYFIDSNDRDYTPFDELIEKAVEEALVPGRGLTRFKVVVENEERNEASVCGDTVSWDSICFGYAKKWSDVPWISFDHFMTRDEVEENYGATIANAVSYTSKQVDRTSDEADDEAGNETLPKDTGNTRLAHICEIWDKAEKKVIFICPSYREGFLKEVKDPLNLTGFFPIPKPLAFKKKLSSLTYQPIYNYYKEQAKELNRITVRIKNIIHALKVRGFYDQSLEGIEKVFQAEDNTLIPVENVNSLMDGRTLEKSIWLFPVETLIQVLQQLYLQREQVKAIIHELTGIADIMRGSTKASETLGAQEIKARWGGLRLGKMQKEVQRYIRDCLRIVTEIAFKHLPQPLLIELVKLDIPTMAQKVELYKKYELLKQQVMQAQAMQGQGQGAGMPPQPGQPSQPGQPGMPGQPSPGQPPTQAAPPQLPPPPKSLSLPTWEAVFNLIENDTLRTFRIDIETDSTIAPDYEQEKADMGEFLNAIAQFLNGALPLTQSGYLPFPVMKSILGEVVRRYKFGRIVEEELEKMQPPPPPPPDAKGSAEQATVQATQAKLQAEMQLTMLELNAKKQELEMQAQLKALESSLKQKELQRKEELAAATFRQKMRQLSLKFEEVKVTSDVKGASAALSQK